MKPTKQEILELITRFINQRPGLEFGNYGDISSYRSELRQITKDRAQGIELMNYVAWHDSIDADRLVAAFKDAYSGRLSLVQKGEKWALEYCTGQYWPTEYRKAACAVLASAIWEWTRECAMPAPDSKPEGADRTYGGKSAGDWLRSHLRREFGRSVQSRWFN